MAAYATVEEYRSESGDTSSTDERVTSLLDQQSAKLRAKAGITNARKLTEDQRLLARYLVIDATRKALVVPKADGIENALGIKQYSFSANGFQTSSTFSNPSGTPFFDNDTFKAFVKSLGGTQRIGNVMPSYGG